MASQGKMERFTDRTDFHTFNGRMVTLYHPCERAGKQIPAEINWVGFGLVSPDVAEEFALGILELVRIGREI